jgi:hypothetical protein
MWTLDALVPTFDALSYTWDGYAPFMGLTGNLLLLGVG